MKDHMNTKGPPADMESVYESLENSREKKDGEDLESVIRNAKRSSANRAVLVHKLDTENNQHPPL